MSLWQDDNARNRSVGIALLSLGTLSFSALDSTVKWLLLALPLGMVVWLRFVSHVFISMALLTPRYGWQLFAVHNVRLQVARAALLTVQTLINFWSIQFLQLTETAAILFSSPLIVALISHLWLGERLRRLQWAAIVLGFVGVLMVVRPGAGVVHPAILLMVFNAVLFAGFTLLTRKMARTENAAAMQFYSALGAALVLTPVGLAQWQTPATALQWTAIVLTGLAGSMGHFLWARAHHFAPSVVLAPFGYQQLLYMAVWGWLLFGDVPGTAVLLGATLIVASGLFLLWEQGRGHTPPPTA